MVVILISIVLGFYLFASTDFARSKPFWGDETAGVNSSVTAPTYGQLLMNGAPHQGSPSPMFYLLFKVFKKTHPWLEQLGIPKTIYWRWSSLGPLFLGCLLFLWFRPRTISLAWAGVAVFLFLYAQRTFYYSTEARPYGFWMITSFFLLMGVYSLYREWYWNLACVLLGATATVSLFQFMTLGVSLVSVNLLFKVRPAWRWATLLPITLGFLTALYYALHGSSWGYTGPEWGTWEGFFQFWLRYKWLMLGGIFLAFRDYKRKDASGLCLDMTILGWFIISPLVYFITRWKGVFFTHRQYLFLVVGSVFITVGLLRELVAGCRSGWRCWRDPWWLACLSLSVLSLDKLGVRNTLSDIKHHFFS